MFTVFFTGIAYTGFNTQTLTLVQILSPDHLSGRILSVYLLNRGLVSLGTTLVGILATFL